MYRELYMWFYIGYDICRKSDDFLLIYWVKHKHHGALCGVVIKHYATNRKVAGSIPDEVIFLIYLILPAALGPGVYSVPET
jgi:hypothetical protein